MEIIVRHGDREVIIRDKRPIVEAAVVTEMLAAARGHLDGDDDTEQIVLPFGFTRIQGEESSDDPDGEAEPEEPQVSAAGSRRRTARRSTR